MRSRTSATKGQKEAAKTVNQLANEIAIKKAKAFRKKIFSMSQRRVRCQEWQCQGSAQWHCTCRQVLIMQSILDKPIKVTRPWSIMKGERASCQRCHSPSRQRCVQRGHQGWDGWLWSPLHCTQRGRQDGSHGCSRADLQKDSAERRSARTLNGSKSRTTYQHCCAARNANILDITSPHARLRNPTAPVAAVFIVCRLSGQGQRNCS